MDRAVMEAPCCSSNSRCTPLQRSTLRSLRAPGRVGRRAMRHATRQHGEPQRGEETPSSTRELSDGFKAFPSHCAGLGTLEYGFGGVIVDSVRNRLRCTPN